MGEAKELCQENSVNFTGIVAKGIPGDKIIQYTDDKGFDHIVIGMNGKGHVGEVLLGSMSYHVIHHANIPVAVVK